jgi:hypothetical protein
MTVENCYIIHLNNQKKTHDIKVRLSTSSFNSLTKRKFNDKNFSFDTMDRPLKHYVMIFFLAEVSLSAENNESSCMSPDV